MKKLLHTQPETPTIGPAIHIGKRWRHVSGYNPGAAKGMVPVLVTKFHTWI
jgi:hypothetical protein